MDKQQREDLEERLRAHGHSFVEGGNLTGHPLHVPGCEGCEDGGPDYGPESDGYIGVDTFGHPVYSEDE